VAGATAAAVRLAFFVVAAAVLADMASLPFLGGLGGVMVEVWCKLIGVNLYKELEVVDVASDALCPTSVRKGLPSKKAEGGKSQWLEVIDGVTGANDQQQIQQ
jgi:hypothetical protein